MSSSELSLIIIPPLCAAIGYLGKYFVDKIERSKEDRKTRKLKLIETKLKSFFYPFHSNLKREKLIYQRILSFFKKNKNKNEYINNQIFWGLEKEILQIQNENIKLIHNNFVEMHFSNILAKTIMIYEEHISIKRILRTIAPEKDNDLDKILWPGDFGSAYPNDLFETIENEMIHLQNQQTYILQGHNIDETHNYFKQFQYRNSKNKPSTETIMLSECALSKV